MASDALDIVAIGDAVVDVLARRDDVFLYAARLTKGTMRLLTDDEAEALAGAMAKSGAVEEMPGGAAANTLAGAAAAGARCRFIGQTGADRLGALFAAHLHALGITFDTPPTPAAPTGRCFVTITPDGERTMQTAPGASHLLAPEALDEGAIRAARVLFLEGYLWGPERPRAAMQRAMELARSGGGRIAFALTDSIALPGRRDSIAALVASGAVDVLFANEREAQILAGCGDGEAAIAALAGRVGKLVVTRGARGAVAVAGGQRVEVVAVPVANVVDTTGAGDQFAAGYLAKEVAGADLAAALAAGARAAAAVIGHVGARPTEPLIRGAHR